ncbi:MAG: hypothetical protein HHJ14_14275 [Cellulomonas sp.]|uniref:hypothetical protein n=1 Tax=Cellulomonas sp. TaxID=40001 RepID=UPI001836318F|nr:hypothetical protein [Cellulomonas sp.]NMM18236.1 hypothetical protein [Cellulomonas sp.]NMM31694.1 hypothetical protein [Cellulomonas sp.]
MRAETPWWIPALASLGISVLVFILGYVLVYRRQLGPQLRHINAQLQDRTAALQVGQAAEALEFSKLILAWVPRATSVYDSPGAGDRPLPSSRIVDASYRLANDPELRQLLLRTTELLGALDDYPGSWANVASKPENSKLKERLGGGGLWTHPTEDQAAFLAPYRTKWETAREAWGAAASELLDVAQTMRERAEALLRAVPR